MPTVCKVLWAQRFHAVFHDPVVPVLCPSIIGNNYSQYFGEGNGTPLQYFCLENPMDTPVLFAWRIPGTGEPGGLLSMGSHRVGH